MLLGFHILGFPPAVSFCSRDSARMKSLRDKTFGQGFILPRMYVVIRHFSRDIGTIYQVNRIVPFGPSGYYEGWVVCRHLPEQSSERCSGPTALQEPRRRLQIRSDTNTYTESISMSRMVP